MTTLPSLSIAGIEVRQDPHGRFSLNDLHRAAGGEKRHQPSNWLQIQQIQDLIAELAVPVIPGTEQNQPVARIQGGDPERQGTYVAKELVYAYAMWISPAFNLKVIRAYDALATGAQLRPSRRSPDSPAVASLKLARLAMGAAKAFGFTGNQAALSADHAVRAITGQSPLALMGQTAIVAEVQEALLTVTEIGQRLGCSGIQVNKRLTDAGLQLDVRDGKDRLTHELTANGQAYGVYLDTGKRHGDGTPVRQVKWREQVLAKLNGTDNSQEEALA